MQVAEGRRRPIALRDEGTARPPGRASARRVIAVWVWRMAIGAMVAMTALVAALVIGPRFLSYDTHAVVGRSMEPTIRYGSVAVFVPARAEELAVGDIISFDHPRTGGQIVTHRVVRIEAGSSGFVLETKGDANDAPDPWRILAEGEGMRYVVSVPFLGYWLIALQTLAGRMTLLVAASVLLGAWALVLIWRGETEVAGEEA